MRLEVGIISLMENVLGVTAEKRAQFEWLCNKPYPKHFGKYYDPLMKLYDELKGDWNKTLAKADGLLTPDAYFPKPYHFIFEFDELQHFTSYRAKTLKAYPQDVPLAFAPEKYIKLCQKYKDAALAKGPDRFRRRTADFPYENGRAAQRAFFDTFRDWLPPKHGLNPTLRITEFEVTPILNQEITGEDAKNFMKQIVEKKLTTYCRSG